MRLLLDECLPRKTKFLLAEHGYECVTVREAGLGSKANGELIALAEGVFDVLVTIDKNIRYQQHIANALQALRSIEAGQIVEVHAS